MSTATYEDLLTAARMEIEKLKAAVEAERAVWRRVEDRLEAATKEHAIALVDTRYRALMDAAAEVQTHWNDAVHVTNQRDQALRSAGILRGMANRATVEACKP